MSNIYCARCSEPWDTTGGLHHSHSDLDVIRYQYLLEGRGCPCCCGDPMNHSGFQHAVETGAGDPLEMTEEAVRQWRRSVEALSEGESKYMYDTFEKEPLPPFDDPMKYAMSDAVFSDEEDDDPLRCPWDA